MRDYMKNAIIYYYNIYVNDINKINNDYYFVFNNDDYVVTKYGYNVEDSLYMYFLNKEMISKGINTYLILLTRENNVLFSYDDSFYFLMRIPKIKNRNITFSDVINFNFYTTDDKIIKNLDKSNWSYFWSNKIDYIEYQFSGVMDKYPSIRESINYYIGLWENAISYYNDNIDKEPIKLVAHKRVDSSMDLLSFLNPINLIIDTKERDIGEYLKSFVINEKYTSDVLNRMLSYLDNKKIDTKRLISRILFPSYYFDKYDDIMTGFNDEILIKDSFREGDSVLKLLNIIFNRYSDSNIPYIEWIKKED